MYFSSNPQQFRTIVLKNLGFQGIQRNHYVLYQNQDHPENGSYRLYQREGFYEFGIADYTVTQPFEIQFDSQEPVMRFGVMNEGTTSFQMDQQPASSFIPSAFLVWEDNIRGVQKWEKGQHFQGAEITVYPAFFEEIAERFHDFVIRDYFIPNHTYHYLPAGILSFIYKMVHLNEKEELNSLRLEAAVLECMGIIKESKRKEGQNAFSRQPDYGSVEIGRKRTIRFTAQDFKVIQKAHDILTEEFKSPPTIDALSHQLLISPQKLKTGFSYYYHMTIGEYVTALKMSYAATLLCTTEKPVAEIAREAGYEYSSNFSRKFEKTYNCTPLKYRRREKKSPKIQKDI